MFRTYLNWWAHRRPTYPNDMYGDVFENALPGELLYWSCVERRDIDPSSHLGELNTTATMLPWTRYAVVIRSCREAFAAVYTLPWFAGWVYVLVNDKTSSKLSAPLHVLRECTMDFSPDPQLPIENCGEHDCVERSHSDVLRFLSDHWGSVCCRLATNVARSKGLSARRFPRLLRLVLLHDNDNDGDYENNYAQVLPSLANEFGHQVTELALQSRGLNPLTEEEQTCIRQAMAQWTALRCLTWKKATVDCLDAVAQLPVLENLKLKIIRSWTNRSERTSSVILPHIPTLQTLDVELYGSTPVQRSLGYDVFPLCTYNDQLRKLRYVDKRNQLPMRSVELLDKDRSLRFPSSLHTVSFHCRPHVSEENAIREYQRSCVRQLCLDCPHLQNLSCTVHITSGTDVHDILRVFCAPHETETIPWTRTRNESLTALTLYLRLRNDTTAFRRTIDETMAYVDSTRYLTRLQSLRYVFD